MRPQTKGFIGKGHQIHRTQTMSIFKNGSQIMILFISHSEIWFMLIFTFLKVFLFRNEGSPWALKNQKQFEIFCKQFHAREM